MRWVVSHITTQTRRDFFGCWHWLCIGNPLACWIIVSLYAGHACIVILYDTHYICVAGVSMQSSRKHHTLCACVCVIDGIICIIGLYWRRWGSLCLLDAIQLRAAASRVDTVVQSCGVNPVWYERTHLQVLIFSPSAWDNRLLSLGVNYRCFQLIVASSENR